MTWLSSNFKWGYKRILFHLSYNRRSRADAGNCPGTEIQFDEMRFYGRHQQWRLFCISISISPVTRRPLSKVLLILFRHQLKVLRGCQTTRSCTNGPLTQRRGIAQLEHQILDPGIYCCCGVIIRLLLDHQTWSVPILNNDVVWIVSSHLDLVESVRHHHSSVVIQTGEPNGN